MNPRPLSQGARAEVAVPSLRRMAAAHSAALLAGFPLALLLLLPTGAALQELGRAGLDPAWVRFAGLFLSYFFQSAALALVQSWFLRRSIPRPAQFVIAAGLAGVALLPALFPASAWLVERLALPPETAGAFLGVIFGAAFAGVESLWLAAGRGRWLVVSGLAWGLAWGVLFPVILKVLF